MEITNKLSMEVNPASTTGVRKENRHDRVYCELPSTILDASISKEKKKAVNAEPKPEDKGPKNIQEFINAVATASGARPQTLTQPYFFLDKKRDRSKRKRPQRRVGFSVAEKRKLGLHLLPRKGLTFAQFVPLHAMWKAYMMDLLNIDELKALGFQGRPSDARWPEFSVQLLKADYHGAYVTVSRSRCPSLVGRGGIVVMETKNALKLIGRDDVMRTVPKESSVFALTLDDFALSVFGKYMCVRSAERSVKKIKARMSADL